MYNIVIAGSTDFTADCIQEALSCDNVNVAAVIAPVDTKKDRKGNVILLPPSELAIYEHIPLFRPENINDEEFHKKLIELEMDFLIVVAYGKILSSKTLSIPAISAINIHGSLLPELRGASPVEHALLQGLTRTGTTLQKMSNKLDEGDIILQNEIKIRPDWAFRELYDEVKLSGVYLLDEFFKNPEELIESARRQDKRFATYCKKIKKEEGRLDFHKRARDLHNQVRAFSEWPTAFCYYKETMIKVFKTKVIDDGRLAKGDYGSIIDINEDGILVQTAFGILVIKELQREGKKRQDVKEFMCGNRIRKGEYFN